MYGEMGDQAMVWMWIWIVISYAISAVTLYFMANKAKVKNPWVAFIPVVQVVTQLHIIDKSGWNFFLLLIPFVNIILAVIWMIKLFQSFGMEKGLLVLNGICFFLVPIVPFIFYLIVAFSDKYQYVGSTRFTASAAA